MVVGIEIIGTNYDINIISVHGFLIGLHQNQIHT